MNGASVEISQKMMTHCLFWRDVVVCLSFTHFCDWLSVDPDAVRLERSSIERKLLWSRWQQKHGWTYQKASSSTNTLLHNITGSVASCYKSHRLSTCLRPLNYMVLFTTITHRFKVHPYFLQTSINCRLWRHSSISDDPLTQFTAKPSFAMQEIAWGQCKQVQEAIYRCQRLKVIYI